MGKYKIYERLVKSIVFALVVRFNYAETYYPGLAEVRRYREQQVARRQIEPAPYRQSYYLTPAYPHLFLNNGPAYLYQQGTYNVIVK